MTNPFEHIVAFADQDSKIHKSISQPQFEQWRQEFSFDALYGIRYGQSFCNHFGITDNILFYTFDNPVKADLYIKKHYIARP